MVICREIPGCYVTAVDICDESLTVARENAMAHQVVNQIKFLQSNLFQVARREKLGSFDFIVSNPPYIDTNQIEHLMLDVKDFEPRLALDGGKNGLKVYRDIITEASDFLNDQGWLVLEMGSDQAVNISSFIEKTAKFEKPKIYLDYSGFPRVITAKKKVHG